MDAFFAPSNRFRDRHRDLRPDQYSPRCRNFNGEVELTGGTAGEILLHRGFTWAEFYSAANGKIVWINPDVFFDWDPGRSCVKQPFYRRFLAVSTEGFESNEEDRGACQVYVFASSLASATSACDILLQLLITCESPKITLASFNDTLDSPVTGFALSHFLIHSNFTLKVLRINNGHLNACHFHAMNASTRTDLQIDLSTGGELTELGEIVLLESIRQNRGPTGLYQVNIEADRLADALRGNNRVGSFAPSLMRTSDEDCHAFFQALAENQGLVNLNLLRVRISDENWDILWQSVSRHPKLENIDVSSANWGIPFGQKTSRADAIVDALRVNTVLHTIRLQRDEYDLEVLDNMVYPRLLVNRYRPRVAAIAAIAETRRTWQRKILGRALAFVSRNPSPNPIWMIVSGNVNVICGNTAQA
jgi:hypothetical protein